MTLPQEMQAKLDAFEEACHVEIRRYVDEGKASPEMLYHYTDCAGLRGILESGTIRLTDVFKLNDPTELKHGFSHAVNIIKQRAEFGPPEIKTFASRFERLLKEDKIANAAHFFVSCFSACGDDLGQWRAYADNGRGFALGFDRELLKEAFTKASVPDKFDHSTFLLKYDDNEATKLHRFIIDKMLSLISLPPVNPFDYATNNKYDTELHLTTLTYCIVTAMLFKHKAYSNEAEYRFLQLHPAGPHPAPDVKYRMRPYERVSYREFDWKNVAAGSLKTIIVGPAADKAKATRFAKDCLKAFHPGEPVEVVSSKIPYRS